MFVSQIILGIFVPSLTMEWFYLRDWLIFFYIMFIFSNALSLCRQPVLQTELLKLWSSNIKWCRLSGVSGLWTQKASYSFIFFSLPSLAETPRDPPWLPEWLQIDRKNHFSLLFFFLQVVPSYDLKSDNLERGHQSCSLWIFLCLLSSGNEIFHIFPHIFPIIR